jgi:peptidoglycan hydrolase-like protein with peptidoglycan-binding domain
MHLEKDGIIENQRLIALGANASLKAASLLIEYSYIYEPQISDPVISPLLRGEMALQTYLGIKKFFDRNAKVFKYDSFLLPHEWKNWLGKDLKNNKDVLALQLALVQEDVYPPPQKNLSACPLTGTFGKCTEEAVFAFQKKYNLKSTGFVDTPTLNKLNGLYGR